MPEQQPATPTETSIAKALEIAEAGTHPALVLDVDETLGNGFEKFFQTVIRLIRPKHPKLIMPTYEQSLMARDIKSAFPSELAGEIEVILEKLRNHPASVRNLQLMHPELPQILLAAKNYGYPTAMYLTTMPESLTEIRSKELKKNNFLVAPVIARPPMITREKTVEWKTGILLKFAEKSPHGIIMVDDSLALHQAIKELDHQNLHSILVPGPMTPPEAKPIAWNNFLEHLQTFS